MNNMEASRILRENRVDISFDHRQASEILENMVENGHLPGQLLAKTVEVEQLPVEGNSQPIH